MIFRPPANDAKSCIRLCVYPYVFSVLFANLSTLQPSLQCCDFYDNTLYYFQLRNLSGSNDEEDGLDTTVDTSVFTDSSSPSSGSGMYFNNDVTDDFIPSYFPYSPITPICDFSGGKATIGELFAHTLVMPRLIGKKRLIEISFHHRSSKTLLPFIEQI